VTSFLGTLKLCAALDVGILAAGEAAIDLAEELDEHRLAELGDGADDHQRNAAGDQAIFDRRGRTGIPWKPR
jgi:hypothetical protein